MIRESLEAESRNRKHDGEDEDIRTPPPKRLKLSKPSREVGRGPAGEAAVNGGGGGGGDRGHGGHGEKAVNCGRYTIIAAREENLSCGEKRNSWEEEDG